MAPTLYYLPPSPPVRAVLMVAKHIGLTLDLKYVDLSKGEHLKPEYLKINPQHTVPTLVEEDGWSLWDSHAIISYLVKKYGKDDSLHPQDCKTRAVIDQRLHFDSSILGTRMGKIVRPIIREGKNTIDQVDRDSVHEAYDFLESFLAGSKWMAADTPTIADYSLLATLSSTNSFISIDSNKWPKLASWLKKSETLPGYEANKEGLQMFTGMIKSKLA